MLIDEYRTIKGAGQGFYIELEQVPGVCLSCRERRRGNAHNIRNEARYHNAPNVTYAYMIGADCNPGLKSRFDNILAFEDYKTDELFTIAVNMLKKKI